MKLANESKVAVLRRAHTTRTTHAPETPEAESKASSKAGRRAKSGEGAELRPPSYVTHGPGVRAADVAAKSFVNTTAVAIPKGTKGVASSITVPDALTISAGSSVDVTLKGDGCNRLKVTLAHDGKTTTLHARKSAGESDLHLTVPLDALNGASATGDWTLHVADDGAGKTTLASWSLSIADQPAPQPVAVKKLQDFSAAELTKLDGLLKQYTTPMILKMHEAWHAKNGSGGTKGPGSGELFLRAHEGMVQDLEKFLAKNGGTEFVPLPVWYPDTDIPAQFPDPDPVKNPRLSTNPHIEVPSWLTLQGGTTTDPLTHQCKSLGDFKTLDDLGRAMATPPDANTPSFHASGHVGVGGTMNTFGSPADPIFWEWHKLIDTMREQWAQTPNGQAFFAAHPDKLKPVPMGGMHMKGGMKGADGDDVLLTLNKLEKSDKQAFDALLRTPMFDAHGREVHAAPVRQLLAASRDG